MSEPFLNALVSFLSLKVDRPVEEVFKNKQPGISKQ